MGSLPSRGAWIEIPGSHWPSALACRSLPSRGAWIEIHGLPEGVNRNNTSLPSRGAWIEIFVSPTYRAKAQSLPSRGAWIEIVQIVESATWPYVAPLTGSVD